MNEHEWHFSINFCCAHQGIESVLRMFELQLFGMKKMEAAGTVFEPICSFFLSGGLSPGPKKPINIETAGFCMFSLFS